MDLDKIVRTKTFKKEVCRVLQYLLTTKVLILIQACFNKEISVTIRKDDENCSPKVTRCVLYE